MATSIYDSENKIPLQGLTFDDVLLIPHFSGFTRSDILLETRLTKILKLKIPFVSSPMDTVTEKELAIALARLGGIGIIHRNLSIQDQADHVAAVKKEYLLVGAAVGASKGFEDRVEAVAKAGADCIIVDSAHGFSQNVIDAIAFIKNTYPQVQVIGGSVATYEGAKAIIEAGADAIRVGMGPGAICTTRIVSGMGVPQITAVLEAARAAEHTGTPVIADGGIQTSGDMVKAFAAGASTVMMGSFFASTEEAPGEVHQLTKAEVPSRFKSITKIDKPTYTFKSYRGMGSEGAMKKGTEIKSEDEFHGKDYRDRVLVAEGVEGLVPVNGSVKDVVEQALGGIKSGLYYIGCTTIDEVQKTGQFMQISQASLKESHPHDILVTNAGKSYK